MVYIHGIDRLAFSRFENLLFWPPEAVPCCLLEAVTLNSSRRVSVDRLSRYLDRAALPSQNVFSHQKLRYTLHLQASMLELKSLHDRLIAERQELLTQLDSYKPRVELNGGTPAQALLELVSELIVGNRQTVVPYDELQRLQSVLLRGVDVYQPEDLACKIAATSIEADVGESLAILLGPSKQKEHLNNQGTKSKDSAGSKSEPKSPHHDLSTSPNSSSSDMLSNLLLTDPMEQLLATVDDWDFNVLMLQQETQVFVTCMQIPLLGHHPSMHLCSVRILAVLHGLCMNAWKG
jgi:hypothetical protein